MALCQLFKWLVSNWPVFALSLSHKHIEEATSEFTFKAGNRSNGTFIWALIFSSLHLSWPRVTGGRLW